MLNPGSKCYGKKQRSPVLLGFADERLNACNDTNAFECKLGGRPVWLDDTSPVPPPKWVVCPHCNKTMLHLLQIYAPLENSPYDRVLYIWGCNSARCSKLPGSFKVVRGHILNRDYVLKLLRKRPRRARPDKSKKTQAQGSKSFASMFPNKGGPQGPAPLPLDFSSIWKKPEHNGSGTCDQAPPTTGGQLISGAHPSLGDPDNDIGKRFQEALKLDDESPNNSKSDSPPLLSAQALPLKNVCKFDGSKAAWDEIPDHQLLPARYLDIADEELNQALYQNGGTGSKYNEHCDAHADSSSESWVGENYERSNYVKGTDAAFEKFVERVSQNPEQCLRYDFKGQPLLYNYSDATASLLNNTSTNARAARPTTSPNDVDDDDIVSSSDDDDDDCGHRFKYTESKVPRCLHCGGRRRFECQLMPALLTDLPLSKYAGQRDSELNEAGLKKKPLHGKELLEAYSSGMEFGTVLVYSCENDCHLGRTGLDYLDHDNLEDYKFSEYYEEVAYSQIEIH